jgi:hypothetical protein
MNTTQFSSDLARYIMSVGDEGTERPCTRIQFKGGEYPDGERDQGGVCEEALQRAIERFLKNYLTFEPTNIKNNKPTKQNERD